MGITIVRYTSKRYSVKFYLTQSTIWQTKIAVQGDCVVRQKFSNTPIGYSSFLIKSPRCEDTYANLTCFRLNLCQNISCDAH